MDGFPTNLSPFLGIGGWLAVAVLVLVSMIRGWLIPRFIYNQFIQSYKDQLEDKDKQIAAWKDAYKASDARGDVLASSQTELLELTKNTNTLIKAYTSSIASQREPTQ